MKSQSRPRRVVLVLASLGIASVSHGIAIRHDRTDSKSRELGAQYPAVCLIKPINCTGTLVAPKWVLTAAHVARSVRPGIGKVVVVDKEFSVARVEMHPDARVEKGKAPDVDVALIELTQAVTAVAPMSLYRGKGEKGRHAVVVGFGEFGDGQSALLPADGRRRAATNLIHRVEDRYLFLKFDQPPDCTELEGASGVGDSGGPSLVFDGADPLVAGISSAVMGPKPGQYGNIDVHMRVSHYAEWIDALIGISPRKSAPAPKP